MSTFIFCNITALVVSVMKKKKNESCDTVMVRLFLVLCIFPVRRHRSYRPPQQFNLLMFYNKQDPTIEYYSQLNRIRTGLVYYY